MIFCQGLRKKKKKVMERLLNAASRIGWSKKEVTGVKSLTQFEHHWNRSKKTERIQEESTWRLWQCQVYLKISPALSSHFQINLSAEPACLHLKFVGLWGRHIFYSFFHLTKNLLSTFYGLEVILGYIPIRRFEPCLKRHTKWNGMRIYKEISCQILYYDRTLNRIN